MFQPNSLDNRLNRVLQNVTSERKMFQPNSLDNRLNRVLSPVTRGFPKGRFLPPLEVRPSSVAPDPGGSSLIPAGPALTSEKQV